MDIVYYMHFISPHRVILYAFYDKYAKYATRMPYTDLWGYNIKLILQSIKYYTKANV